MVWVFSSDQYKNVIAIFLFWPDYGVILEGKNELFKDRLAEAPKH